MIVFMRLLRALTFMALAIIISGCQSPVSHIHGASDEEINAEIRLQKEMVFTKAAEEAEHVEIIMHNILLKNAELCTNKARSVGFLVHNIDDYRGENKEIAESLYQLDHVQQVEIVYPHTDAHKYGLKKGDKIIAVNGIDVSSDKDKANKISDAFANNTQDINKVLILSDNTEREIALKAQEVCNYRMLYFPNSLEVNAMADGKRVFFMRGMYRIAKDDNELALIIGHEIAHNVMKHSKKKEWNSLWLRGLANAYNIALILRTPYVLNEDMVDYAINEVRDINSVDFEREADYIGMYFAERAGYDTSNAIRLWRKMAVEFSGSAIEKRNTHPATAERFVYLQKTHDEIKAKRQNNQPLIPEVTWRDDRIDIDLVDLSKADGTPDTPAYT